MFYFVHACCQFIFTAAKQKNAFSVLHQQYVASGVGMFICSHPSVCVCVQLFILCLHKAFSKVQAFVVFNCFVCAGGMLQPDNISKLHVNMVAETYHRTVEQFIQHSTQHHWLAAACLFWCPVLLGLSACSCNQCKDLDLVCHHLLGCI